jgi:hypothetical protein
VQVLGRDVLSCPSATDYLTHTLDDLVWLHAHFRHDRSWGTTIYQERLSLPRAMCLARTLTSGLTGPQTSYDPLPMTAYQCRALTTTILEPLVCLSRPAFVSWPMCPSVAAACAAPRFIKLAAISSRCLPLRERTRAG